MTSIISLESDTQSEPHQKHINHINPFISIVPVIITDSNEDKQS